MEQEIKKRLRKGEAVLPIGNSPEYAIVKKPLKYRYLLLIIFLIFCLGMTLDYFLIK